MLKSHMVQVFLLNLEDFNNELYNKFYEAVSEKRRERAERYFKYEDSLRCVMSEILVRYAYNFVRGSTQSPQFVYRPKEKPYLANDSEFHFSISHTGKFVAVGCAKEEIGIDVEYMDKSLDLKNIASSVFTADEQSYIFEGAGEREHILRFTQLWTAKESYLKYLGCGFRKSPLSFSVNLKDKTISDKTNGIVPDITVLGNQPATDYYLSVCGNVGELSVESVTCRSVKDIIFYKGRENNDNF